ncbi:MAG: T9SS type A sorting domain-containing protein [Bacteroidales bacterium]|nr:T9SS type A sorting domain-containing protein [Bacteroidales bacterium]
MKRHLSIAALLLVTIPAFAQQKQSEVVASAGGFGEKDGYSVSFTIGEAVTGTLAKDGLVVVQGFQQGYAIGGEVNPAVNDDFASQVDIYPNPVNTKLFVALGAEPEGECIVRCFDMTGRLVGENNFEGNTRLTMDVENLPQGAYFVKVFVDGMAVVNRKIMKY